MNETEARMVLNVYAKAANNKEIILDFIDWLSASSIVLDFDEMSRHKLEDEKPENLVNNFLGINMERVEEARTCRIGQ